MMPRDVASKKYTGVDPYRKDYCHCFPEPMFTKEEAKTGSPLKAKIVEVNCLRCGLPITEETIMLALSNRGRNK
jgi:hypothetical protein